MQVFRNEGTLFENDGLAHLSETPEWQVSKIAEIRRLLEELLEKREINLETQMTSLETQYNWVAPVLRLLGFTFSVSELSPDTDARPDMTLFYNADDFRTAVHRRGEREFFAQSLAVLKCYSWNVDLADVQLEDGPGDPGYLVDRLIRATGVSWGILTNGRQWRLYHRESSGLMSTYFEVDLYAALSEGGLDEFKYFWTFFSPEGLGGFDNEDPITYRLLH